ncbi:MAG: vanadium-dependent haloperoxidase [Bacteroidota bacterium]
MKLRHLLLLLLLTVVSCTPQVQDMPMTLTKAIVTWNQRVLHIAEQEDGFLTLKGLRTTAMMHLAIHDVLNHYDSRFETYKFAPGDVANRSIATIEAAVNQAAYSVASNQYPDQQPALASLRDSLLVHIPDDDARKHGLEVGESAATLIMGTRQNDGWNTEATYQWHPMAPGVYAAFNEHSGTPDGFIFGAGWGQAAPFAFASDSLFTSPPPPAINSAAYTEAFNEVKSVGQQNSTTRSPDQTHLALWWKDFVENSHNRLARQLAQDTALPPHDAARLFALLNVSVYDAYINAFHNKFLYNHWRPYTAIRWAANDENPNTSPDTSWNNTHKHTYAFPSYPSAHGTACAAAVQAMKTTFGEPFAFTMTTASVDIAGPFSGKIPMKPATRSFASFDAAAKECAASRVYLGIHFRYDSDEGYTLGARVGKRVTNQYLQPTPIN